MTPRICAAGLAAVVGIVSVFAPVETSARPAGFSGRSATFHGGHRAPFVRPPARAALPTASKGFAASRHGIHHRRPAGFGVTGWWGGYGSFYDPSNYVLLHDRPVQSFDPAAGYPVGEPGPITVRVIPAVYEHRMGCQAQTQSVAVRSGGERAITIVRC